MDDNDDDLFVQYRDDVLGKDVWVAFPVEEHEDYTHMFYKGVITKSQAYFPDDDVTKSREYEHWIKFGDGDDGYYDLSAAENSGELKWSQAAADAAMEQRFSKNSTTSSPVATATAPAVASVIIPAVGSPVAVVTPQRRSQPSNNQPPAKRPKIKLEFGNGVSNIHDDTNNKINSVEFKSWLQNIHKGARGGPLSDANVRQVMNRAKDLIIKDRGVSYVNWPSDKVFHQGQTVTLDTDFDDLMRRAHFYENTYGEDKGHGWLLRHPIKKLMLFQQYVQAKRQERSNPEFVG
ncbi:MAG: hypothetical protein SGILL_002744 [Bacillariaceae sp.]